MKSSVPSDTCPDQSVCPSSAGSPAGSPAVGGIVDGKYRLLSILGKGGMGSVYLAEHVVLRTYVALKFMHPHLAGDRAAVGRFMREARAAATLQSEFAARVLDVVHDAECGPYIVMEHLQGRSLDSVGKSGRGLDVVLAVRTIIQACDALGEAHARGIVHRDVKPANLFLTHSRSGQPFVKVLDFGLAIDNTSPESAPGSVQRALGTPHYMSPEQIRGGSLDLRSDIWSLGVTLHDLLTARPAYEARTTAEVFARIMDGAPRSLSAARPDVPLAIVSIIERCQRKRPSERFHSMRDLAMALEAALASLTLENGVTAPDLDRTIPSVAAIPSYRASVPSFRGSLISMTPMGMMLPTLPPPSAGLLATLPKRRSSFAALCMPALIAVAAAAMAFTTGASLPSSALAAQSSGRAPNAVAFEGAQRDGALHGKHEAPPAKARQAATVRRGAMRAAADKKSNSPS